MPTSPISGNEPETKSEHLTQAELARWLRCSTRTLQRLLSTGDGPPAIQLSTRRLIFPLSDARSWLATRTKGAKSMVQPAPFDTKEDKARIRAQAV